MTFGSSSCLLLPLVLLCLFCVSFRLAHVGVPQPATSGKVRYNFSTLSFKIVLFVYTQQLCFFVFSCWLALCCLRLPFVGFACQPGKHYPIALWGPILLGTIGGCGGLFLPLDRGLQASNTKRCT